VVIQEGLEFLRQRGFAAARCTVEPDYIEMHRFSLAPLSRVLTSI
jgi:hypothetical protein